MMDRFTSNILGRIIVNEHDNEFFRDTISELLMKIKLTYSDLEQHSKLIRKWEEHSNRLMELRETLRQAHDARDSDLYDKTNWLIQITDENQREIYTEIRREERKIEEQMLERQTRGST